MSISFSPLCVRSIYILLILVPYHAIAADYCVENETQFQAALIGAVSNKESDIIRIVEGTIIARVKIPKETGFSISIKGGFTKECKTRFEPKPQSKQIQPQIEPGGNTIPPVPQQNTTGPTPPPDMKKPPAQGATLPSIGGYSMSIIGVPGYEWRHGCGPTALGMVLGYWKQSGFTDLFDGLSDSQSEEVNQGIASQGSVDSPQHYEDYSLPNDSNQSQTIGDKSELPAGDEHISNSIADSMETSWSNRGNKYGWSWSDDIIPAFNNYVLFRQSEYKRDSASYDMPSSLTWEVLTTEIDNERPMIFLVDTNSDGDTDHFVTIVGYSDSPTRQYACLDTWYPYNEVRWADFKQISSGQTWGIWGGWSFELSQLGDINNDRTVDLKDAIISLQITSGNHPSSSLTLKGDVNNNNTLGLEESIFALRKAAGLM